MDSTVKSLQIKNESRGGKPANLAEFFIRHGMITFAKKDFRPGGESPELTSYYEGQVWYMPDPTYTPVVSQLTQKEQDWLKK
jgi:hypothetical protein